MVDKNLLERVLLETLSTGGDFADIFVEERKDNNISLISGKIETALTGTDFGVGIRLIKDLFDVYAYTNDASEESLMKLAKEIAATLTGESKFSKIELVRQELEIVNPILEEPSSVSIEEKIEYIKRAEEYTKNYSPLISQVKIQYNDHTQKILVANSDGEMFSDTRVRCRMYFTAVASRDGEMQTGTMGPGASRGFDFIRELDLKHYGEEAARIAVTVLDAELCPSGQMPVVIDNGFGGVIFHEACGHGLEATSVAKGTSVFCNRVGELVANPKVTAVDDGREINEWGTLNIDDEGVKPQRKVLIENGILKGYMVDKLGGKRMGVPSTGSGRRQSYAYPPTSRMNNTYIMAGNDKFEDMISSIEYGLYAKYMGGGSVNPATGDFNFAVMEGYLIENGKITRPVKGATLIGNGPKVLMDIEMVGDNFASSQGMCGSVSGSIPTNVGQPAIKVRQITVGGRK